MLVIIVIILTSMTDFFFIYLSVFCILDAVQYLLIVEVLESEKNKSMSNNIL